VKKAFIIILPVMLLAFVFAVFFFPFAGFNSGPPTVPTNPPDVQTTPPDVQTTPPDVPTNPPDVRTAPPTVQTIPPAAQPAAPLSSYPSPPAQGETEPVRYIFGRLSPAQQTVYERFRAALQGMDSGILISRAEARAIAPFELIDLYYAVLCDYPEIFWSDNYIYTGAVTRAGESGLSVTFTYTMSAAERDAAEQKIAAYTTACLNGLSADASDFDKILYVYEYIIRNTAYDASAQYNQDIVSVFLSGRSVCMGYTKATQYLLQRLGFTCATISGAAAGIGLHAWNLVEAEGDYYYLDTTWGDPDLARNSYASYDYFLVTGQDLAATHHANVVFSLPECTATRLNYFQVMNRQFDRYDRIVTIRAMREDLAAAGLAAVRFSSTAEYERAIDDLFDNQSIFQVTNNSSISYFLTDELRIITVLER
jgi:hypothetical protein